MKLLQHSLRGPYLQQVSLPRPDGTEWAFLFSPLPLGFYRQLRERGVVPPQPPIKVARDSSGRPMRDASGLALMMADERDPAFVRELELYHQRVAVLSIAQALQYDPNVSFEASLPAADSSAPHAWLDYADALYGELGAAGFTDGDLIQLCGEVCRLSNLLNAHLASARQNFSLPPTANTA